MIQLEDLIDRFSGAKNHDDCWDYARRSISQVGGNAINVVSYDLNTNEIHWVRSSMTQSWLSDYTTQSFASCDPFVQFLAAPSVESVVAAGSIRRVAGPSTDEYELNHQLKDAGYHSLVATKVLGTRANEGRMVVISSTQKIGEFYRPEKQLSLRRLAVVVGKFMGAPNDKASLSSFDIRGEYLTPRELEVLTLLADGKRNDVIAHKMGVAEVTIRKHLLSARKKLGAVTREEALVKAILQGRIQP
jgi:DNA-binding CsgD family transcriptional regulator